MRKIIAVAGMLLVSIVMLAQQPLKVRKAQKNVVKYISSKHVVNNRYKSGVVYWENDFNNPAEWVMTNQTSDEQNWVIDTVAPSGPFEIPKINSTSGGNFALFDSDLLGSDENVQDADLTIASPINLSGYSAVSLQFEQFYRRYEGQTFVYISKDGVNWEEIEVNSDLDVNEYCQSNPTLVRIDITSIAADQPQVWIRFNYKGGWDYAWMVDDVKIIETPSKDIAVTNVHVDNGANNQFFEYGEQPASQAHVLNTYFTIENRGGLSQDVSATVTVIKSDSIYGTFNLPAAISLGPGTDTTVVLPVFNSSDTGRYSFSFTVGSTSSDPDADMSNNTLVDSLYITDGVWSDKECQQFKGDAYSFLAGSVGPYFADVTAGQAFQVINSGDKAYSITTVFPSTAVNAFDPDQPVYVELNRFNNQGEYSAQFSSDAFSTVASAPEYVVSPSDVTPYNGNSVYKTISFSEPVDLSPGIYFATIHGLGGEASFNVGLGASRNSDGSGLLKGNISSTQSPDDYIGYSDVTPFIKLNLRDDNATNELKTEKLHSFRLEQNSPNPFNQTTVITYELNVSATVVFKVTDITGKEIKRIDQGKRSVGQHSLQVNADDFGSGIYFYSINAGGLELTRKMMVSE